MRLLLMLLMCFVEAPLLAEVFEVKSGGTIQEAINKAKDGDTVKVYPGVYREAIYIDKQNFKLIGVIEDSKWPLIEGSGILNDGVIASGNGFVIENFHIARFKANGVTTQGASDVVIRHLLVEDTGIYGIYPTYGKNILIEDTVTWGIADAGIYVGMCDFVDVRRNELFENVAGIEIENSHHVLVEDNNIYNNAGGILVFVLPGLPKKTGEDIIVRRNHVIHNNYHNFAEAGAIVASVPPGTGIIILAADKVTIEDNIIRDNKFAGIVLADLGVMPNTAVDPKVDPNPDNIIVGRNFYHENGLKTWGYRITWLRFLMNNMFSGASPEGAADLFPPGADLAGTSKGKGSCYVGKGALTTVDIDNLESCADDLPTTAAITTMIKSSDAGEAEADKMGEGERWYNVICAGCHAYGYRSIGPSMKEVQEKYKGRPEGIAKYAMKPTKVRAGFPMMPPQAHIGLAALEKVGEYILQWDGS